MDRRDLSFEEAVDRLNRVVRELEEGELPLEKALQLFAEGVSLVKYCRETLDQAEQRVRVLTADLEDFIGREKGNAVPGGEEGP